MSVDVISKVAIKNGADSPIIDALAAAKGFAVVADTTERGTIKASVKLGGFLVYRVNLPGFEFWNGTTWVTVGAGGGSGDFRADGTVAMTADLNFGGNQGSNAGDAAASTDLTTLQQVQALIAAAISTIADWKQSVRFATTTALPASTRTVNSRTANANGAFPTVDGVTAQVGDRFLDKDNATGADRGYWQISNLGSGGTPWAIVRTSDADSSAEVTSGMTCEVEEGTENKGHFFILTTPNTITLNTTALTFSDFQIVTGDGLTVQLLAGVLSVIAGSIGTTQLANSGVTTAKIANAAVDLLTKVVNVLPPANGGSAPGVSGGNLTNANVTKNITDGTDFTLPASTLVTSAKTLLFGTSGTPRLGEQMRAFVYPQSQNYTVGNGGALPSSFVINAGEAWAVIGEWMGTDWLVQPLLRLA